MRVVLLSLLLAACLPFAACGSTVTITVSDDASVNRANADSNLNALITRGGLFSGLDDTDSDYEFYLKFNLPPNDPSAPVTSAKLIGTYTDDFNEGVDSFHQFYFVPSDAWSQTTITFNNKPAVGDAINGASFDAFSHQIGDTIESLVTDDVKREMAGDGVLSLRLATIDGRLGDMEFFASREFNLAQAFRLEITTSPAAVPLPAAVHVGALLLAGLLVRWRYIEQLLA